MDLLWRLLIGAAAGFLAGAVMKGRGFGILGNIVVGILGGFLGGWLFDLVGLQGSGGTIGALVVSFVGAVVLLWIVSFFKKQA